MVENRLIGDQVARDLRGAGRGRAPYGAPRAREAGHRRAISSGSEHDLGRAYADLVYNGLWFSQTREAIDAFVRDDPAARHRRRSASNCSKATAASSAAIAFALYDQALATYDAGDRSTQRDEGFIKIWGLPIETAARKAAARRRWALTMAHLWSGRFAGDPDAELFAFGSSFRFDRRLFEDDVRGSLAWAEGLERAGVLSRGGRGGHRARRSQEILADGARRSGVLRPTPRARRRGRPRVRRARAGRRASATPAAGCTPDARATSRSRSICACT